MNEDRFLDEAAREEKLARLEESEARLKKIIESLLERENHYRILAELSLDIVFIVGEDRRLKFVNDYASGFFGKSAEDLTGQPVEQVFPPRVFAFPGQRLERVFQTGEPDSVEETISLFGRRISLDTRLIPVRDKHGAVCSVLGVARDITQRKQYEDTIKAKEEFLTNVFESFQYGIYILDRDFTILRPNRMMDQLYKWEAPLAGKKCYKVFHGGGEPCADCSVAAVFESGQPSLRTMKFDRLGDRTDGWMEVHSVPLIDSKTGQVMGVVTNVRDVTERKLMEAELQKTQRLESLGALASGIAHEFNNILTMIIGNISLSKLYPVAGEMRDILDEAEKASLKGRHLANQLLTFSKTGEAGRKAVSVGDIIRDAVSLTAAEGLKFEISVPEDLWPVHCDEGQISQVINNLLINAQQGMPEGGVIKVSAANVHLSEAELIPLSKGDYIRVSFEDRGGQIPSEHMHRMFDPFFNAGRKNAGLGLAISYSIVKKHGGQIFAESRGDEVTVFNVYLPAFSTGRVDRKQAGQEDDKGGAVYGRGKILLMDDEEGIRVVIARMLEQCGYSVELASDGDGAVEMYTAAMSSGNPYDAVILDLIVSGGTGGKEAVRKLLEIDPRVRAVASSGYYNDPVMSRFSEYGFKDVLAKPYLIAELCRVLGKVVKG